MDKKKKYFITAAIIYGIGILLLCLLKFYASLVILIPGMFYTFYKLYSL